MKDEVRILAENAEGCILEDDLAEIESEIRAYVEKNPDDPDGRTVHAEILVRLDKEAEAETILRSVLQEYPLHERASSRLGRLCDNSLRCDEAEQIYRSVLAETPDSHVIIDDLCRLLYGEERNDEALSTARNHIQSYPEEPAAYEGLRYLLHILEDDLESEMLDERDNPERNIALLENLLDQHDLVTTVERIYELQQVPATTLNLDIDEELLRLVGEIERVYSRIQRLSISIQSDMKEKLELILTGINN